MGSLHSYPVLLRLGFQFSGFVGQCAGFPLNHVADIDLACKDSSYRSSYPFLTDLTGNILPLPLVIQRPRRRDAVLVQLVGDLAERSACRPHVKDMAHDGRGFFINDEVVFIHRVPFVSEGGISPHEFPVFRTGFFDRLDLFAGISTVKFVKKVQKAHNIGAAVIVPGVNAVIEGDEPATDGRKQVVRILPKFNVVSAEPGKVFYQNDIDSLGLCVLDQPLDTGPLKIRPGVSIINIDVNLIPAPVPNILLKQELLIFDAGGFAVTLIIVAQSAIDADIVCSLSHLFYLPACQIHTLCGAWLSSD